MVAGPPDGELAFVLQKFMELSDKNGPFSAAFIMGGVPTVENDLTALFDLIKSEFTSKNRPFHLKHFSYLIFRQISDLFRFKPGEEWIT